MQSKFRSKVFHVKSIEKNATRRNVTRKQNPKSVEFYDSIDVGDFSDGPASNFDIWTRSTIYF